VLRTRLLLLAANSEVMVGFGVIGVVAFMDGFGVIGVAAFLEDNGVLVVVAFLAGFGEDGIA